MRPPRIARVAVLGERGRLVADLAARLRAARVTVVDAAALAGGGPPSPVDAAIECTVVDAALRARHLAALERALPLDAPLWVCCHASDATTAAAGCARPRRVAGFALLPPISGRSTVECALPLQSSGVDAVMAGALWGSIGLEPVWVADGVGLVLPRIVAGLANEALFAVQEGVASAADVDRAMVLGMRLPRGPLAWAEMVGLDHVLATLDALEDVHRDGRYRAAPLLRRLVQAGVGLHEATGSGRDPSSHPDDGTARRGAGNED